MPWLFAIAARRLADRARRHARQAAHGVRVEQLPDASFGETVVFGGDTYRDPEALRKAVQHLPQKQRIAIEMLKLREMSLKEGSAASGMSTGALRASIHRALPMLREALTAYRSDHYPSIEPSAPPSPRPFGNDASIQVRSGQGLKGSQWVNLVRFAPNRDRLADMPALRVRATSRRKA